MLNDPWRLIKHPKRALNIKTYCLKKKKDRAWSFLFLMDKENRVCLRFCFDDKWTTALLSCFTIIINIFLLRVLIKNLYWKYLPLLLAFGPSLQRTPVVNRRALFEELKCWFLRRSVSVVNISWRFVRFKGTLMINSCVFVLTRNLLSERNLRKSSRQTS